MSAWYVRDRGHEMGPFSVQQLRDMRSRRQIHGYHEVSQDRRAWQAADLVPGLLEPLPPPPVQPVVMSNPIITPRPHDGRSTQRILIGCIVAVIVALAGTGVYFAWRGQRGVDPGVKTVDSGPINFSANTSDADRDKVLQHSVAFIIAGMTVTYKDGSQWEVPFGTGSGFTVTDRSHLITNRHVIEDIVEFQRAPERLELERKTGFILSPKVWAFFGRDQKHEAEIVHHSSDYDFAVLKVARDSSWYFTLCETEPERLPLLDKVSALGFPGEDRKAIFEGDIVNDRLRSLIRGEKKGPIQSAFSELAFEFSKRQGNITTKASKRTPSARERAAMIIQHSAAIYQGNSGGPLITPDGTVIGINTWGRKDKDGISFALTMPQLRNELNKHIPGLKWRPLSE